MKNKNMRLKGQLRMYMQWPLIMTILLLAMNIWMYMTDQKAGLTMTVFVIIYVVIVMISGHCMYILSCPFKRMFLFFMISYPLSILSFAQPPHTL